MLLEHRKKSYQEYIRKAFGDCWWLVLEWESEDIGATLMGRVKRMTMLAVEQGLSIDDCYKVVDDIRRTRLKSCKPQGRYDGIVATIELLNRQPTALGHACHE